MGGAVAIGAATAVVGLGAGRAVAGILVATVAGAAGLGLVAVGTRVAAGVVLIGAAGGDATAVGGAGAMDTAVGVIGGAAGGGGADVGEIGSAGTNTSVGAGRGVTIRATVCRVDRQVGSIRSATPASDAKPNNRLKRPESYSQSPPPGGSAPKTMRRFGRRRLRPFRSASKQSGAPLRAPALLRGPEGRCL